MSETTGIFRVSRADLDTARADDARESGHESAEQMFRIIRELRHLPSNAQTQLAVCFEWAREGIARQHQAGTISPDLEALHEAYAYARDEMLSSARRGGK